MTSTEPGSLKLLEGTEVFDLSSAIIDDVFKIRVFLPYSYEDTDKSYPILYLLDSDRSFGLAASAMSYLNLGINFGMGKNVPEMIIVGIGYERGLLPWLFTRIRDYTPSEDPSFNYNNPNFKIPQSGQADKFIRFLLEELMPRLESNYRIDNSIKALATHSMAGLFALYTLFRQSPIFNRYIIASPFVGWDNKFIFKLEEQYAKQNNELKARLFMTLTGHEPTPPYIDEVKEFITILQSRNYNGCQFTTEYYENENHFSSWPKAFTDGLMNIFA